MFVIDDVIAFAIRAFFDKIFTIDFCVNFINTFFTFRNNDASIFNMFEISTNKTLLKLFVLYEFVDLMHFSQINEIFFHDSIDVLSMFEINVKKKKIFVFNDDFLEYEIEMSNVFDDT